MYTMQQAIHHRISQLMTAHGINVSELARRAHLRQSTVNDIVRGKVKNPSMQAIYQIAEAFHLTLSEFTNDPCFENIEKLPMKSNR